MRLAEGTFDKLPSMVERLELEPPAAVLADLGCSSLQIDDPERGFSFSADGPLDMRMGAGGPTAAELLERMDWEGLVRVLRNYGEERRAAAIARAIIKNAPIIILDEPGVGLDSRSSHQVMGALETLMKDRTVVMISHRLETIQGIDRVLVLDGGSLVDEGTHEELLERNSVYQGFHRFQVGRMSG